MNSQLESLKHCADADDLKPLLHAICSGFGEVTRLDVLVASQVGKRQALCFLRMATLEQEQSLMRELHIGRFGGDMVVIVALQPTKTHTSKVFPPPPRRDDEYAVDRPKFQPTLPMASYAACSTASSMASYSPPVAHEPRLMRTSGSNARYG